MSAQALSKLLDHLERELGIRDAKFITVSVPYGFDEVTHREVLDTAIRAALGRDEIEDDVVVLVRTFRGWNGVPPVTHREESREEMTEEELSNALYR